MFAVGQTVVLNKSPMYGECPDYVSKGMTGKIKEIQGDLIAVDFGNATLGIYIGDLDMVKVQ